MEVITALGNEKIAKKIKENVIANIVGTDIQYKEAVIEILEKNEKVKLLILNSILPGELDIYEFINILKYKNPELEIIIILEKENEKLEKFIITKGINNIYYNNKTTINEIIEKINEINNKNKINILEKNNTNYLYKKIKIINIIKNEIKKILDKIINKNIINLIKIKKNKKIIKNNKIANKITENKIINKIKKNKKNNKKNNNKNKIITIIGAPKVGKTIFSLIFSLNIENKKILIINLNIEKNDIKIIIGKKTKKTDNIINWKKEIDILTISKKHYDKNNIDIKRQIESLLEKFSNVYDYIIIDLENIEEYKEIIKKSDTIVIIVEANLLGIKETKEILEKLINKYKNQKDKIKIIYNKQTTTSIQKSILDTMFSDFEIAGEIQYDNFYNFFINTNGKFITKKIKKQYLKITKKII